MRILSAQHRGFCAVGTQPKPMNHLPATTITRRVHPLLHPTTFCTYLWPRTQRYSLSCNAHALQPSTPPTQSASAAPGLARTILAQPGIEGDPLAFLELRGWRVAIVEKRLVQGRNQEWNISWGELEVLVELGLLSRTELREAVVSEFNPIRVGFQGGQRSAPPTIDRIGCHSAAPPSGGGAALNTPRRALRSR
ncbi:hypothetical protein VOLCADRAFT_104996 [Volvox carteri f. nagariensis]|uniref:Uncharacterized protein n=1 Tax=Volvox carteri f. nagariensis TaxID=3068 RepID=D8TXP2_VOLCA|nr:uncharacterized protein VOLCADRAFT_104996 [Volvox carteri f. nagariensis]EFJ47675.1 hypothetical protein VOLCADRAFT_104996 [Volvox carteri f. nagariensis]|eukprot:XP_002951146.1 hypothetical protein VOLCADRAFT_104996 [Volvox carteri f. nagariensis]